MSDKQAPSEEHGILMANLIAAVVGPLMDECGYKKANIAVALLNSETHDNASISFELGE